MTIMEKKIFFRSDINEKSDAYGILSFAYLFLHSYAVREYVSILCSEGLKYKELSPMTGNKNGWFYWRVIKF